MKIICIEEHAAAPEVMGVTVRKMMAMAPYMGLQSSGNAYDAPRDPHYPSRIGMEDAVRLMSDMGDGRIAEMDRYGVDMQIMSHIAPVQYLPAAEAVALARIANDKTGAATAARPDRLGGFILLPWQDPDAAVAEVTRAVQELGLRGVLLPGRPAENAFLDDPIYFPILERIAELGVPLYLHPFFPTTPVYESYYAGLSPMVSAEFALAGWGWHHEAGIHVIRLILAGLFDKLPELHIISGHWGEMVPFYLARMDVVLTPEMTGLSRTVSQSYRDQVWVTPSGMFDLPHFEFIHKVLGADRIIWATDYPFLTMDGTRDFLQSLPISEDDRVKIAHKNAEALFKL